MLRASCCSFLLLAAAPFAAAHFKLTYPAWRADTLSDEPGTHYSQYHQPCGGATAGTGNRTEWPLHGGSVVLELHHAWTYVFINLGLGTKVSNFNISLTPSLTNVTGKGTFCLPTLTLPVNGTEGQNATIQVVTSGQSGTALYNCADITFRSTAKALSGKECTNTTGISATVVDPSTGGSTPVANSTGAGNGTSTAGASGVAPRNSALFACVAATALAFAMGLGL